MSSMKWPVVAALIGIVCVCGCTSYDYKALIEQSVRQQAEKDAAAKARTLPPLPDYPEGAMPSYGTASRLVVLGNEVIRNALCSALQEAGYHVMGGEDVQVAALQPPDIVLRSTWTNSVEYGNGAAWLRGRLVVSLRSPLKLGADGMAGPMADTRCFQTYARVKISDTYALLHAYEHLYGNPYYAAFLNSQSSAMTEGKEATQEAMKTAVSRLMHIDAFRRAISLKSRP